MIQRYSHQYRSSDTSHIRGARVSRADSQLSSIPDSISTQDSRIQKYAHNCSQNRPSQDKDKGNHCALVAGQNKDPGLATGDQREEMRGEARQRPHFDLFPVGIWPGHHWAVYLLECSACSKDTAPASLTICRWRASNCCSHRVQTAAMSQCVGVDQEVHGCNVPDDLTRRSQDTITILCVLCQLSSG